LKVRGAVRARWLGGTDRSKTRRNRSAVSGRCCAGACAVFAAAAARRDARPPTGRRRSWRGSCLRGMSGPAGGGRNRGVRLPR